MVPLDPMRDESGQKVEWTMWGWAAFHGLCETCMNVNSASQPVRGLSPSACPTGPEVYLSWKEEKEKHAEHRGHEQAPDTQCQLHPPPVVPGGQASVTG